MRFPRHLARLQPNGYTCGPSALRHALLCYGVRRSVRWLARVCEAEQEGTNEYKLYAAARALGLWLPHYKYNTEALTQESIRWHIKAGHPVLCCVDVDRDGPWNHWVCLVGAATSYVTICDSSRPGPVIQRVSWARLFQRLGVRVDPRTRRYDIYPLVIMKQTT